MSGDGLHERCAYGSVALVTDTSLPQENEENGIKGFKKSSVPVLKYSYPLTILLPDYASSNNCKWIFINTYGGGLVQGDRILLDFSLGPHTAAVVTTSSSTKVYCCPDGQQTLHHAKFNLGANSLLAYLTDPVVCFKDAIFTQSQEIYMDATASLVYVDWYLAGRTALGEVWDMNSYENSLKIYRDTKLVVNDRLLLNNTHNVSIKDSMKNFTVFMTVLLIGNEVMNCIETTQTIYGRAKSFGECTSGHALVGVSPLVSAPGITVKIAAQQTSKAYEVLDKIISPLYGLIGGNPYENKY